MTIASIDIGTNTVLLLIAEVDSKKNISALLNKQKIPRIGKGLKSGEKISEEKEELLYEILQDYNKVINAYKCNKVILTATNAFRIASNGKEIVKKIKEKYGFDTTIIAGEDEAKFAYLGATANLPDNQKALVIDIGGGSTELTYGKGKEILFNKSFQVGVVSGTEYFLLSDPPLEEEINKFENYIENLVESSLQNGKVDLKFSPDKIIAIAGTPTTLACIKLNLEKYDEDKVEGETLTKNELKELIDLLSLMKVKEIKKKYESFINGREDLILAGSIILFKMMEITKIEKVSVSTKGIRYGAVAAYLNSKTNIE